MRFHLSAYALFPKRNATGELGLNPSLTDLALSGFLFLFSNLGKSPRVLILLRKFREKSAGFYSSQTRFSDIRDFKYKNGSQIFSRASRAGFFCYFQNFPALRAGFLLFSKIFRKIDGSFVFFADFLIFSDFGPGGFSLGGFNPICPVLDLN